MNPWRLIPVALVAACALAASACGGDSSVPEGSVAVVDGTQIPREDLDALVERARRSTEAQDQEFPKVGTPEFQNVQKQYVAFLVQKAQFENEAQDLGVKVTDADIDKEVSSFVKSRFPGSRGQQEFRKALKQQGFTLESFRDTIRTSVLSQKLYDALTKDIEVPDAEVVAYYQQNASQYATPESRDVRHILIQEQKGGKTDFAASKAEADRIYTELQNGADFAALAKAHSADTGSAKDGGKLTISKGQTVPEFEKTSFALKQGEISKPVKTQFGYHIIEALSPVRKATTTPLDKVKASIEAQLLQQKKSEFMTKWVEDLRDDYDGKVHYALGFEPPELPDSTDTETDTTSTQ
jgi:parvulin-like peptidyl-prolyl isomerase